MPDRKKIMKGLQCIIDGTVRCESCGYAIDKHGHHSCQQNCASDALTLLKEQETKHGEWLESKILEDCFWVCSECEFPSEAFAAPTLYKYCPNCGVKMDRR